MRKNLEGTNGLIFSQKLLLELVKTGASREEAYRWVQEAAMETWRTGRPFEESVRRQEAVVSRLDEEAIREIFTLDSFLKEVDAIFERVV
jgi:adenylosuccinate lyase